jgi:hypothetical protein
LVEKTVFLQNIDILIRPDRAPKGRRKRQAHRQSRSSPATSSKPAAIGRIITRPAAVKRWCSSTDPVRA